MRRLIIGLAAAAAICAWTASAGATTLVVNTTRDELGSHGRVCSLREAIAAVDSPGRRTTCGTASRRSNTIMLRAARYALTIPSVGADDETSGDLDVTGSAPLAIIGTGTGTTIIDASRLGDRALSVATLATLTLHRLRITGGHAPGAGATCGAAPGGGGGGILNSGSLTLDTVVVAGNRAGAGAAACAAGSGGPSGGGGGVLNLGRLTVVDSTIRGNLAGAGGAGAAGGSGGSGGGIYNQGTLSLTASTLYANSTGAGGIGGGAGGSGGGVFSASGRLTVLNSTFAKNAAGADGGAIAVSAGRSVVRDATVAENAAGTGGGLFAQSAVNLQNTIVASNLGANCAASTPAAIGNAGHDLSYGDRTCPGGDGNPRLGPLQDNGGPTSTFALGAGSAAIGRGTSRGDACPPTDQRGVRRPERRACDIGAYEFAVPTVTVASPVPRGMYLQGSRILARFRCEEGGVASAIAECKATVRPGRAIKTAREGTDRFVVTALDKSGNRTRKTVRYSVFEYVNPVREVSGLTPRRIDLGVDYAGSGPILAIGDAVVTMATDSDSGPSSCWAISCWPGGGIVVYRLLTGPFAGKYTYVAEHLTVTVRVGQRIRAGQQIATLYSGYPWSETGWAAGPGPEALGMADGHQCPCSDPGDWSTIDGRTMNNLLVAVGAPSGLLQGTPDQSMPRGWPTWPS